MKLDRDREQAFWWAIFPILAIVSVGKGIRLPNYNSATQAQVDYRLGMVKRGLFGTVFSRPLHLEHYKTFVLFSWAMLLLTLALLLVLTWRSGLRQRVLTGEVVALFFSSYSLTYMAHMVGYFEVLLTALTIALLLVRQPWLRLLCSFPVVVFSLLVHELFLIVFLPVILFSFLVQAEAGENSTEIHGRVRFTPQTALAACGFLLALCLSLTVRLALQPPMTRAQVEALRIGIAQIVDFPPFEIMYLVMVRSTADNLAIMKHVVQTAAWWRQQLVCLVTMAPTIVLLLLTVGLVLRSTTRPVRRWLKIAALLAGLSPLAMHLLGFDVARFNALVVLTSFLVLLVACRFTNGHLVELPTRMRHWVLLVMLLNMASGDLLMDGRVARPFPFIRELPQVLPLHHGKWEPRDPFYKPQY